MKRSLEENARRFDELAERYDRNADEQLRQAHDLVVKLVDPRPEDVLLDVGCGTGSIAVRLAPKVKRFIGIDISERMLDEAMQKAGKFNNVSFGAGSFQRLDESIDLAKEGITKVISNYALSQLDAQEKRVAIERMAKVLPVGGVLVVGDLMFFEDPEPYRDLYDPMMADPSSVRDLLAMFKLAGTEPEEHRIHPIVGVIRAVVSERGV